MENNISYIPMEPALQQALKDRYTKPFRRNVMSLIISLLIIYGFIIFSLLYFKAVSVAPFAVVTIGFLLVFWMAYPKFKKMNLYYLDDANFGQIVKEQTYITKVFDTPAGINIYWLNCAAVKTFTPDPYRLFSEGDHVTIYYLKYSQDYLAYEA